jgi:hypothetical protein
MRPPAADPRLEPLGSWARRALLAAAVILSACASAPKGPQRPPLLKVVVHTSPGANDGQPFYVVFQAVNEKEFTTQSYRAASDIAFTTGPGVLATTVVLPDREQSIAIPSQDKDEVAAYFLLTHPGRSWKVLLPQPLADKYVISVVANEVEISH